MAKTKIPPSPFRQIYFGQKPSLIEKNLEKLLEDPVKLKAQLKGYFEENERIVEENNSLKEKLKEKDQENTNLKNGFDAEKINWVNEKTKLEKQVSAITVSRDEAWKQLDNSHKFTDKIWVCLGNRFPNPPLFSLNDLKWLLRKHDKPTTDNDYYTLYDLLRKRDEHIAEIKQLRADLSTANDKLKAIASIDPRTIPEYKLLQVDLEKWTNVFPTDTYPTPNDVAKKITDLQTDLATKISISLEDQKKIDSYDALKLERDNLKIRRDNWKTKFENAELKLVDLPINWKTELTRIPDLEKRPNIPVSKSDWENDWSNRPTLTDYNNLLANQKPNDLPDNWKELDKTVKKQKEQIDKLVKQLEKEKEQTKNLRTNIHTLTNENETLRQKVKDLENKENENLKKIQTLSSSKDDVDNILTKWKASNLAQLSSNIETTISKRNQFQLEIKKLEKEKTENKKTIDNQSETIKRLQQEIIDLEKKSSSADITNRQKSLREVQLNLDEAKKELEELKRELKSEGKNEQERKLEELKRKIKFGSGSIEQWMELWNKFPDFVNDLFPNGVKLFPCLERHKEKYDAKYTCEELNEIWEKIKDEIEKEEREDYWTYEKLPQLEEKIKFAKEKLKQVKEQLEKNDTRPYLEKRDEIQRELDKLERIKEKIIQAKKITKIRETSKSIDSWFKEFQIIKPQLDKLHKLNEAGIITIDFDNTLYSWEEVAELLKKPLPLEKQTITQWWLKKGISDEDYFLLKKKGADVDIEKLTQKEVWELVDRYSAEPSTPKEKQTLKGWYDKRMINQEQYELLLNIFNTNPNQEFTLQEITNRLMEETLKEKGQKPVPPKPPKKLTIRDWYIMEKKITDEDYILLKKARVDTEKEEMTLAEVNNLIVKYDK